MTQMDGKTLRDAVVLAANRLNEEKELVDALNVFPVPDGDTGTNMSMTIQATAREVLKLSDPSVGDVVKAMASASLRGARGNSGVILSQLFRGFSAKLKEKDTIDAKELAEGFRGATEAAYRAVKSPKEGTILTVAKESAKMATQKAEETDAVEEVLKAALEGAKEALIKTPDLLPVLKQAGVVDSGGQGYVFILEGMLSVFSNEGEVALKDGPTASKTVSVGNATKSEKPLAFPYCTEFIILKESEKVKGEKPLQAFLERIGDSTLVVDDGEIIKVHVHTMNPGAVLSEALKYGMLSSIKIDNMQLQSDAIEEQKAAEAEKEAEEEPEAEPEKPYGFVTVAAGDGIAGMMKNDLQADAVIEGGQTMNPSTDDLLKAVRRVGAHTVFILPNNKNIILTAEQVAPLVKTKKVVVLPTRTIPEGMAALMAFMEDVEVKENIKAMEEAIKNVRSGSVTFAVRDTVIEGREVEKGSYLGILGDTIAVTGRNVAEVARGVVAKMVTEDSGVIALYRGAETESDEADALQRELSEAYPQCDVLLYDGNQPLYYYYISVE